MQYRVRETGQLVTETEFRRLHSNTSFPEILTLEILESFGVDPVLEGPQPNLEPPYQISVGVGVEEINGQWFTKYVAGPTFTDTEDATAAEQEAAYRSRIDEETAFRVRKTRDQYLAETDWLIVRALETNSSITSTILRYRQELRDLPKQPGFPHNVEWPQKP